MCDVELIFKIVRRCFVVSRSLTHLPRSPVLSLVNYSQIISSFPKPRNKQRNTHTYARAHTSPGLLSLLLPRTRLYAFDGVARKSFVKFCIAQSRYLANIAAARVISSESQRRITRCASKCMQAEPGAQCPSRAQQKFLNGTVITIITFATPSRRAHEHKSSALVHPPARSLARSLARARARETTQPAARKLNVQVVFI